MKRFEVGYIIKSWVYVDANSPEEAEEIVKKEYPQADIVEINELNETALSLLLEKIRSRH